MTPALSELGVSEFLVLTRMGFVPRGLVIGSCLYHAGTQYDWTVATSEVEVLSRAMRQARQLAVARMRQQAVALEADGVVDVRLEVEHHLWRGARIVAKCVAVGTAVVFDRERAPVELRGAPGLRLSGGEPFDSDLSGADFVMLLGAGYRPVTVAMGCCVFGLDPRQVRAYRGRDVEIGEYTRAYSEARELAMERLQQDLFQHCPPGHPDSPVGIVGMTVREAACGGERGGSASGIMPPIVEFTALGTAIARLPADHPWQPAAKEETRTRIVVSLDR